MEVRGFDLLEQPGVRHGVRRLLRETREGLGALAVSSSGGPPIAEHADHEWHGRLAGGCERETPCGGQRQPGRQKSFVQIDLAGNPVIGGQLAQRRDGV